MVSVGGWAEQVRRYREGGLGRQPSVIAATLSPVVLSRVSRNQYRFPALTRAHPPHWLLLRGEQGRDFVASQVLGESLRCGDSSGHAISDVSKP